MLRPVTTLALKLALYPLGQHLPQFNAPLVEAVDVPQRAFDEGDVLVIGD